MYNNHVGPSKIEQRRGSGARFQNFSKSKRHRIRGMLSESQNHRCAYCGFPMYNSNHDNLSDFCVKYRIPKIFVTRFLEMSIDHVDSNGDNIIDNMVVCHSYCNNIKGSKNAMQFYDEVQDMMKTNVFLLQKKFNKGF